MSAINLGTPLTFQNLDSKPSSELDPTFACGGYNCYPSPSDQKDILNDGDQCLENDECISDCCQDIMQNNTFKPKWFDNYGNPISICVEV